MSIAQDRCRECLGHLAEHGRDLFFYAGLLSRENVLQFYSLLEDAAKRERSNASLVLATYGGDPHQAFRLARFFRDAYESFRLVVLGPCKSAGTLVAVGADELAMGPHGELGPLDVQVPEPDTLARWTSGVDTTGAFATIQAEAHSCLAECMQSLVLQFGETASAKTVCEAATGFVSGLFAPIVSRIDPQQLAAVERKIDIAAAYARQLGAPNIQPPTSDGTTLERLVRGYPSHGHIIDLTEARRLFQIVDMPSDAELLLLEVHPEQVLEPVMTGNPVICDLVSVLESTAGRVHQDEA